MKSFKIKSVNFLFMLCTVLFTLDGGAQESPISPDRPSFSPGTAIVAMGKLNAEFGYVYHFKKTDLESASSTAPNLALRFGTSRNVELQLQWAGWNYGDALDGKNDPETEVQDINLGAKIGLLRGEKLNLSAIGLISIPIDKNAANSGFFIPTMGIIWDHTITHNLTAFGIFQGSTFTDDDRIFIFQPAAGLSYTISEKAGCYVEYFGDYPSDKSEKKHIVNAGLSYLITNDLALDLFGGKGLNDYSGSYLGAGMSVRL
jgi:hypothetical protein